MDLDKEELEYTKANNGTLKDKNKAFKIVDLMKIRIKMDKLRDDITEENKFATSDEFKAMDSKTRFLVLSYINGLNQAYYFLEKYHKRLKEEIFD